jgi:hypothetical protein
MKYLKNYKLFEFQISRFDESDVNDVFEAYINRKLIEDAKDMALEYIAMNGGLINRFQE